jgi:hypothetical protein
MRTELSPRAAPRPFAWREFLQTIRSADRSRFAGLIDFSYQHYALGDALTTEIILACEAIDHGCDGIDLYLIIDPLSRHRCSGSSRQKLPCSLTICFRVPATLMLWSIHVLRSVEHRNGRASLAVTGRTSRSGGTWRRAVP